MGDMETQPMVFVPFTGTTLQKPKSLLDRHQLITNACHVLYFPHFVITKIGVMNKLAVLMPSVPFYHVIPAWQASSVIFPA